MLFFNFHRKFKDHTYQQVDIKSIGQEDKKSHKDLINSDKKEGGRSPGYVAGY